MDEMAKKSQAVEKVALPEVVSVQQILDIMSKRAAESQGAPDGTQPFPGTRSAKRAAWAAPRQLTDIERHQIVSLATQVGVSPLPDTPRDLEQAEVDTLILEARSLRDAEDVMTGRYDAIRTSVFNAINVRHNTEDEPDLAPGELFSPETGGKFVREVRGGKPIITWEWLEGVVAPKVWDRISRKVVTTVTTYHGKKVVATQANEQTVVDEDAVLAAIQDGTITLDEVAQVTSFTKKTAYFHVKDMTKLDFEQIERASA